MNDKKTCTKCKRELPLERFEKGQKWCKNCRSSYISKRNGCLPANKIIVIERMYKTPHAQRILDVKQTNIKLINPNECFVELVDYKNAWISSYGRVLEYNNGKHVLKRLKENGIGEKVCVLRRNVYNGKRWIWQKQTIEVWRLVVDAFIVNYDMVGNTCCWHKNNNRSDNFFEHIYPVNEKQYHAILEKHSNGERITDSVIFDIVNSITYKEDDWYENKWKRTTFDIGYLGCNNPKEETEDIYIKWANMMQRCYNKEVHKAKPYYSDCTVCPEWHNYSNYREWHKANALNDIKFDLDKDILIQGNKVYSPETCSLVPHFANTLFEERGLKTKITKNKDTNKYDVSTAIKGKKTEIGTFDTYEEAKDAFIKYKQDYIRDFAKKCKGKVPNKTYLAMLNWKVEDTK